VLEHVTGNRIDAMPIPGRVNHVDHAGLLLVPFVPFAIQVVKRERDLRA
jgi:hypothetical protein